MPPETGRNRTPWFATIPSKPQKPKVTVVRPTATNGFIFESPAQIEERVMRMATAAYNDQKKTYDADAVALKLQAEGRQRSLQAAYEAAAKANAGMGADIQSGWTTAGQNISGLAQTATGGVRDALLADLASTDAALARVGAGGTGFDALSQAGVEQYRGGIIPGEFDIRMGGVGRQFANEAAIALNNYGLQTGKSQYAKDIAGIDTETKKNILDLDPARITYQDKLRAGFQKSQLDQQNYQLDQQNYILKVRQVKQKADAAVAKAKQDKIELDRNWKIALSKAKTASEVAATNKIHKEETIRIADEAAVALNAQRIASAEASRASAALSGARANDIVKYPGSGGGTSSKIKTVSDIAKEAGSRIGQGGMNLRPRMTTDKRTGKKVSVPYRQILFEYLLVLYGDSVTIDKYPALKLRLMAIAKSAPRPTNWGKSKSDDPFGDIPSPQ